MFKVIVTSILFIAYLIVGIVDLSIKHYNGEFVNAYLITFVAGVFPFLYVILNILTKNNLKAYFWFTRILNRIKNPTSKWNIIVSYRGKFNSDIIDKFSSHLLKETFISFPVKIMNRTNQSINFVVQDTLNLYLEYENASINNKQEDTIAISFPWFEISCNNSERKLNQEIVPLLDRLNDYFKPESTAYTLNIDFMGKNPFYTVFIDHLKLEQIDDFNVNLNFGKYCIGPKKDRVTINKDKIYIMTTNVGNLKELAKDFIFLSPDLSRLLQCKSEA